MIHGLKLQIPGDDLKAQVEVRLAHHTERAGHYDARVKALAGVEDVAETSNNPIPNMVAKRQEHLNKATFFGLIAKYIDTAEVYEIEMADLIRLEFVAQWF